MLLQSATGDTVKFVITAHSIILFVIANILPAGVSYTAQQGIQ